MPSPRSSSGFGICRIEKMVHKPPKDDLELLVFRERASRGCTYDVEVHVVDLLVRQPAVVLQDVVVVRAQGGRDLLRHGLCGGVVQSVS